MIDLKKKHDEIFGHLSYICKALNSANIPHAIADGTLLGAVREKDILKTEERDFDIDICHQYANDVLSLNKVIKKDGYEIVDRVAGQYDYDISYFFDDMKKERVPVGGAGFIVNYMNEFVGDIYVYTVFGDGFARRYCLDKEASVNAKMTIPAWYFEGTTEVTIRREKFHGPRLPEDILRKTYGEDWRTPLKPGEFADNRHPDSGSVYDSDIERLTLLALENGWKGDYANCPEWPRDISHVGSYAGRRWLVRHEAFAQLLDRNLFTQKEHDLLRGCLGSSPGRHVRETILALVAARLNMARQDNSAKYKKTLQDNNNKIEEQSERHAALAEKITELEKVVQKQSKEKKEVVQYISQYEKDFNKLQNDYAIMRSRKSVKFALAIASAVYKIRQAMMKIFRGGN